MGQRETSDLKNDILNPSPAEEITKSKKSDKEDQERIVGVNKTVVAKETDRQLEGTVEEVNSHRKKEQKISQDTKVETKQLGGEEVGTKKTIQQEPELESEKAKLKRQEDFLAKM